MDDLDPGTVIGEPEHSRAVPASGFAPVVANDEWESTDPAPPRWCVPRGGLVPRLHRPEHFVMFDFALPRYRRCARCGATLYVVRGRGSW